jgi:hypothetical protein
MNYRELTNEQRRQWLDFMQVDDEYRSEKENFDRRFIGSMRWLSRNGTDYLHVKKGRTEKSIGPRGPETEKAYLAFIEGRDRSRDRLTSLRARLEQMAPVNRAFGLGRVPILTSKILRVLDESDLLGTQLLLVGTNALWAYEAKAGLQLQADVVATADADMLWDPRASMKLLSAETHTKGVLGLLRKVDESFETRGSQDYRAINKTGFAVDLIRPEDNLFFEQRRNHVTRSKEDVAAAPIFGLHWLANAPKFESMAIAEDGFSVRIPTIDPRAFSLHKIWLSAQPTRDPIKIPRDLAQAKIAALIARKYLNLEFDESVLRALPQRLRNHIPDV